MPPDAIKNDDQYAFNRAITDLDNAYSDKEDAERALIKAQEQVMRRQDELRALVSISLGGSRK